MSSVSYSIHASNAEAVDWLKATLLNLRQATRNMTSITSTDEPVQPSVGMGNRHTWLVWQTDRNVIMPLISAWLQHGLTHKGDDEGGTANLLLEASFQNLYHENDPVALIIKRYKTFIGMSRPPLDNARVVISTPCIETTPWTVVWGWSYPSLHPRKVRHVSAPLIWAQRSKYKGSLRTISHSLTQWIIKWNFRYQVLSVYFRLARNPIEMILTWTGKSKDAGTPQQTSRNVTMRTAQESPIPPLPSSFTMAQRR